MSVHPRLRVLYVDNHADCRSMLSNLLRLSNIDTVTVSNATEALSRMQTERFDMYLLEVWLPDMDGFELCRQLRQRESRTPILFYSSAAYDVDKQTALRAGANEYISKPDIDGLVGSVERYAPRAQAAVAY